MPSQKYYRINRILKLDCEYNMLFGERSNGKSYAVKEHCIEQAFADENKKFILLRRWQIEIKGNLIDSYFNDAPISAITKGEYSSTYYYRGNIYLCNYDTYGKITGEKKLVGYVRALSASEHYKSGSYNDVENILFEEFLSKTGYLADETTLLMSFVSTVARRRKIRVWLIGNTISRICPYFTTWELVNIPKQKQGTIDIYRFKTGEIIDDDPVIVKIAVEFCENSGNNSRMFFGQSAKMITSGVWDSETQPKLEHRLETYRCVHKVVFCHNGNKFLIRMLSQNGNIFAYVEPKTTEIKENTRVVADFFNASKYYSNGFIAVNDKENYLFSLIRDKQVVFSDNLTGTEFYQCLKERGL